MEVTTEMVKELRDMTGISVMQCKKALVEADGDMEKAKIILEKKSKVAAQKKSDRTLGAGAVAAYIHSTGTVGTLVELSCETDFVGKNDEFKALARDFAMHIAASNPEYLRKEDIDEKQTEKATEVFKEELEGTPEDMREKILAGKLASYFKEKTLLEQKFIKNPEMTIQDMLDGAIQKFGEKVEITRFSRFSV
jgi:elongation factor Ts